METSGTNDNEDIDGVEQLQNLIPSPDGKDMKATTNIEGCKDFTVLQNATANTMNVTSETTTINMLKGHGCSNNCQRNGTMEEGALDILMKETNGVFVETSIFKRVEEALASYHHVTISGASGEGKTSIALMIGDKYRTRGYQLLLVNNIDRFRLHMDGVKDILLIFDDIFGTVGLSTDVPHLQSILGDIHCYLSENTRDQNKGVVKEIKSRRKIYVIFTTKPYNLHYAISKLDSSKFSFFKGRSVFDLSKDCRYNPKERKDIFQKHKHVNDFEESIDIEGISNTDVCIFGFPLTCKLFFKDEVFQKQIKTFFQKPLICLKAELSRILQQKNDQSAALILMLLCDGSLNLQQLESGSEELNTRLKAVESIVPSITPTDIARAAREFTGTYFTEGEVIGFSHPSISDACAYALNEINLSFVLEYCSIRFLYERVQPGSSKSTAGVDHEHIIYVSKGYHDIIAKRLAQAINDGNYSMSISHPILKEEAVVDNVFDKLKFKKIHLLDHWLRSNKAKRLDVLHGTQDDKYLLQWAVSSDSIYLIEKILTIGYQFPDDEIIQCLYTCATGGNTSVMGYLLRHYKSRLSQDSLGKALSLSVDKTYLKIIKLLIQHGADLKYLSHERQKLLFNDAANQNDRELCEMIITAVSGNKCKQLHNNVVGVQKGEVSPDCKTYCNENLVIACIEGNINLADIIIGSSDINSRGHNGLTPVMNAANSGNKAVFDLLLTNEADFKLTDNFGDTVLHFACWGGNTSIIEHLLPLFDINSRGQFGWTPVMNAACSGKKEVFDLLLTNGADLKLTDNFGDTVLHFACWGGKTSIVQHLLSSIDKNSRGHNGGTPVMIAACSGNKKIFDLLVRNKTDLTLFDNDGNTVLHHACRGGNASIVEHLLHIIPSFDINSRGQFGRTPLMNAVYSGKKRVFDLLVTKGADLTLTDNDGDTALQLACWGGNASIVEDLLPYFDINGRGQNGRTPVMKAAHSGEKEVFDLLLTKRADITLTDDSANSVLHHACDGGNTSVVEHLLQSFDINSRGQNGWTPVMFAVYSGKKEVFDLLVIKRADLTLTDYNGDTVLHLACRGGNISSEGYLSASFDINNRGRNGWTLLKKAAYSGKKEVFDLLVTKGADLTHTDNDGGTMFHRVCYGGTTSIVKHLLQSFDINKRGHNGLTPVMNAAGNGKKEVFDLLVTNGANLKLTIKYGDTVLHLACWGGNASIVDHLLQSFDKNSRGHNGWTPVMFAVFNCKKEVFHLLVTKGADLTLTDNYGDTVLHLACQGGNASIVEHLLPLSDIQCRNVENVERLLPDFDINIRGRYGWTPVMMAARYGHMDVLQCLISHKADLSLVSDTGEDVLNVACCGKSVNVIEVLLSRDEFAKRKVLVYLIGNTLLHLACMGGNVENVEHLLPDFDINVRGRHGWTPVMMAAYYEHLGVLQCLISRKANLSLVSETGEDVLCLAKQGTNTDIVTFLLTLPDFSDTK